ncbi:hypothetical protein [Bacillus sp. REN3]|uniref:hypothetical protein n=1 Tax=Bacillus sp. REN3 TaxID=2802440 RepID=UPI001AEE25A3|nr:hypothetical protein [Bacillus sp. REN3]
MNDSFIDFHKISQALSSCSEALADSFRPDDVQLDHLREAEANLRQALSFSLSTTR